MPCDSQLRFGQQIDQRKREVEGIVDRLEQALGNGTVQVVVGPQGEVAFAGWDAGNRNGVTDLCAYRRLTAKNSFKLQQAVIKAEIMSGRKVNTEKVKQGVHSHDGGKTFDPGHGKGGK